MKLPELTPLQFVALHLLFHGAKTGRELRRELAARGLSAEPPTFSRLMIRLQTGAYVQRDTFIEVIGGRTLRQRSYRLTDLGLIVWNATQEFYASLPPAPPELETVQTIEAEFAASSPKRRKALCRKKMADALTRAFFHLRKTGRL